LFFRWRITFLNWLNTIQNIGVYPFVQLMDNGFRLEMSIFLLPYRYHRVSQGKMSFLTLSENILIYFKFRNISWVHHLLPMHVLNAYYRLSNKRWLFNKSSFNFHITILIHFYINLGIAVIFLFFFSSTFKKKINKRRPTTIRYSRVVVDH
jgi:hypothetical protein